MYPTVPNIVRGMVMTPADILSTVAARPPVRCQELRQHAGQSEVQDLDASVAGEKDVLRLQIAVNDSLGVGCAKALGHGHPDLVTSRQSSAPRFTRDPSDSPSSSSMTA